MWRRRQLAKVRAQDRQPSGRSAKVFRSEWQLIVAVREVLGLDPRVDLFRHQESGTR
jgi:hypothetical protein